MIRMIRPLADHLIVEPVHDHEPSRLVIPHSAARPKPWRFRIVASGMATPYAVGTEVALHRMAGRAFIWEGRPYLSVHVSGVQAVVAS